MSKLNVINHLNAATNELDDCVVLLGLPAGAIVADVRTATMARLANAERAVGKAPAPSTDVLIRVRALEAESVRLDQLYRARRQVMGFNAQAEAIQAAVVEKIDDGAQAGRAWARFLAVQGTLKVSMAMAPGVDVSGALAEHSSSDEVGRSGLEDIVSVPEAELAEVA